MRSVAQKNSFPSGEVKKRALLSHSGTEEDDALLCMVKEDSCVPAGPSRGRSPPPLGVHFLPFKGGRGSCEGQDFDLETPIALRKPLPISRDLNL